MDDAERDDIQDALDEEEGYEGGTREGAVADEEDEAVREPNLPGEEVVMTSRGVSRASPATRAPRPEVERARREKRTMGQAGVEVPDTGREKKARQTTIDEMYAREKLAEFTDAWLQWIYVKKLPFNVFRGPEFQRVRQAAERVPRSIQFRFPSYRVTLGIGIPSQRAKVATMVSKVRATFRHSGATILSEGRKSRSGRRDALESMLHGDAWARIPWDHAHVSQAQWVQQEIRDGEFWQRVQYAILVMSPVHQLLCKMDRSGMMMSVVYEGSQHLLQLMRRVDVPEDMIEPCMHRRRSGRLIVQEREGPDEGVPLETERCAAWWFEHGRAHPELRTIAIRVMHLWTSASPEERNWAEHERVSTARRCKLGLAKLAQLVEMATNLKLASCARQGGGYVLPWVMGTGRGGTAAEEEDEEGDVEPEVWGARPDGSVFEQEIQRQIVAFRDSRPSRARSVQDVFGSRATELRPWPEVGDDVDVAAADGDIDDDWTNDDDTPLSRDQTAERVYFTYGGGRDGMDSFTSVITGDVSLTAQASGSSRAGGGRGGRSHAEVHVDDSGEQQPRGGLRHTGRRWEVRSDNEVEDEEVPLPDRRFSPSHHPISSQPEALRRSERLASAAGRDRIHDGEDRGGERTPSTPGEFDYEGQDAAAGGGSGGGRRGDEETAGVPEGQDVVMSGGSTSGGRGESETAGDEGQGAAVCGRGEGGPGGDGDTAGIGGDDGPDGDDDDDHGLEDDPYRLALVLRDPTVPPLRPEDTAHTFFDVDALAHALTDDRFTHVSHKSGKQRAPERVYSPPPFTVQSPHSSGSTLSGVRGRDSGAGKVGFGRRSDGDRDSAGSMPPPPARTPEARVDTGDGTAAPGVGHSGGSPPTVRGGVGGEWSAVRRVGDRFGRITTPGGASSRDVRLFRRRLRRGLPLGRQHWTRFRGREGGIAAQAEEDEDADTESEPIETAARRHRAQVAAAAAAAHAAYVSGARGTGVGGRGGRRGGPHGRPSSERGRARSGGR
ncbi:hypothetical protein CBR_g19175 [Chara braunii]|uniref:HAT C-terminal dimerisation domain-containing protein n=1 Tax=Chara braunii TaxID=69332 RepID=A0A388JTG8_CHABU|nr:hypothetical protein CBR_g19175 [Chara braunii]|eukprot:GBG61098.1 hypothetical protein CBR_g19175 [Chara braunii]